MSAPKYMQFFNELIGTVNGLDTLDVKLTIGDSINNNRTLTVGQVTRYLLAAGGRRNVALGRSLQSVYNILKADIKNSRFNSRTDAIDINEFINFYSEVVIGLGEGRGLIGRSIAA